MATGALPRCAFARSILADWSQTLARPSTAALAKLLPPPNTLVYVCPASLTADDAQSVLMSAMPELDLSCILDGETILVEPVAVTWTREARRRRARGQSTIAPADSAPLIRSRLAIRRPPPGETQLRFESVWTWGRDRQAFESLHSHLSHRLADHAKSLPSS